MTTKKPADAEATLPQGEQEIPKSTDHRRNYGDWEFRPWRGRDHWVNKKTGHSTFKLKEVRIHARNAG